MGPLRDRSLELLFFTRLRVYSRYLPPVSRISIRFIFRAYEHHGGIYALKSVGRPW